MKFYLAVFTFCSFLLLGAGCSGFWNGQTSIASLSGETGYEPVTEFLLSGKVVSMSNNEKLNNGKLFVAYENLGEKQEGATTTRYIWAVIQGYYMEQGVLKKGSGASLPLAMHLAGEKDHKVVSGYEMPGDGSLYGPSIKRIFPPEVQEKIFYQQKGLGDRITFFIEQNKKDAEQYFSVK